MKKMLLREEEAAGRTVERVELDDRAVAVLFTDGTALALRAYGGDEPYLELMYDARSFDVDARFDLGLITDVEHKELTAKADAAAEREQRATYERLRLKFGEPQAVAAVVPGSQASKG